MRIGIDLGGTKIAGGVVNAAGQVIKRKKIPTDALRGYEAICDDIAGLVDDLVSIAGIEKQEIERVGVAAAGQINKDSGVVLFSPNLGWHDVPLRADVEKISGIATFIENDVNAAVYGEWRFGLRMVPAHVLGIFPGTGIGGGLILDGRLYRGATNVGGEVGHMSLNPFGYQCRCGNTGCFEAYCGGAYIAERAAGRVREGYRGKIWDLIGGDPERLNAGHVEQGWLLGDDLCVEMWREVIEYFGAALAGLANLLNPEVIILGGGVIEGTKYLMPEAVKVMEKRAMAASLAGLKVERAKLGEDAAIIGAAFVEE